MTGRTGLEAMSSTKTHNSLHGLVEQQQHQCFLPRPLLQAVIVY